MKERVLRFNDFDVNENYSTLGMMTNEWEIEESLVELTEDEFISLFDVDHPLQEKAGAKAGVAAKKTAAAKKAAVATNKVNSWFAKTDKDIAEITPKWDKNVEGFMKERGNYFREWVNKAYPEWAKKNELSVKGSYNNAYIKKAWNEFGIEYFRRVVRARAVKVEIKKKVREVSQQIGLKLTRPNYGKTSDGNTVTGGLFDFNDRKTFEAVRDMKNMVINGVKYTCIKFGESIKAVGEFLSKTAKEAGQFLINCAKFVGKTIIFTGALIYVVADEAVKGFVSLANTMWGFAKKGAVVVGNTIAAGLRNINEFFVGVGDKISQAFKSASNFAQECGKKVMEGLYTVAKTAQKAKDAIAALTVAAYNKAKAWFGSIKDWTVNCVYNTAKAIKQTAINIGNAVKDFYDNSVKVCNEAGKSIMDSIKNGWNKFTNFANSTYNKSKRYVKRVKNKAVQTYKKVQNKVVQTAKEIYSHGVAIFKGLFDSYEYSGDGGSIYESYIQFGNGEKFYIPTEEGSYYYDQYLV